MLISEQNESQHRLELPAHLGGRTELSFTGKCINQIYCGFLIPTFILIFSNEALDFVIRHHELEKLRKMRCKHEYKMIISNVISKPFASATG